MQIFYEFQQRYININSDELIESGTYILSIVSIYVPDRMTEKHKKNKGDIMSKFLFAFLCVFRKKIP